MHVNNILLGYSQCRQEWFLSLFIILSHQYFDDVTTKRRKRRKLLHDVYTWNKMSTRETRGKKPAIFAREEMASLPYPLYRSHVPLSAESFARSSPGRSRLWHRNYPIVSAFLSYIHIRIQKKNMHIRWWRMPWFHLSVNENDAWICHLHLVSRLVHK
jgi:hypothetical protein